MLKRDLQFRRRTLVDVVRAAVRVAVSLPLALGIGGAISIAAGIVASEFAAMLLLWILVPIRPATRLRGGSARSLLGFGGQVTVIRILGSFRSTFDYIIVGSMIGATALGFYGMAYKLPELLIENVLWIFSTIALPMYARARTTGTDVMLSALLRATRLLALYGLTVGTALAVVARDAVPVLFSDQWTPAVVPMMLISLSLGIMSIAWASGDLFSAVGRPGILIKLDVPATIAMAAAFLFAARYGLVGRGLRAPCLQPRLRAGPDAAAPLGDPDSRRITGASGAARVAVAAITAAVGFGVRAAAAARSAELVDHARRRVPDHRGRVARCCSPAGRFSRRSTPPCRPEQARDHPRSVGSADHRQRTRAAQLRQAGGDRRAARPPRARGSAPTRCTWCWSAASM